tara:strand:- start:5306 stop:6244 length:939 start_codon:yes stop_codon:yes gene_type:complete
MKVLITGASGFIGKSLVHSLGEYNLVLTNRSGNSESSFETYKKNISSTEDYSDCLKGIDVVVHVAAKAHQAEDHSKDSMNEFFEINFRGTLNLAQQAARAGVKRFIFISTIKVNGEKTFEDSPFRFDSQRLPEDAYAKSKAEAEIGLFKLAQSSDLEVTVIRPPLVYGVGVKANFGSFLKLASINLPMPFGALANKRSFVSLDNLIDLIVSCIDHPKAGNDIFLVSDDDDMSTKKIYTIIVESFGKRPKLFGIRPNILKLFFQALGKRKIADRLCDNLQLDIEHTKVTLGWKPKVQTKEAMRLIIGASNKSE